MAKTNLEPWAKRTVQYGKDSETRTQLLEAARRVFDAHGYAATTVAQITTAAGVSRAGFYVYFSSKEDVFRVIIDEVRKDFLAAQNSIDLKSADVDTIVEVTITSYYDTVARHSRLLTILAHQALADDKMMRLIYEIHEAPLKINSRFVKRLQDSGVSTPAVDPDSIGQAVAAIVEQFVAQSDCSPDRRRREIDSIIAIYRRLIGLPDRASST